MDKINEDYVLGFMAKAAELGVDPEALTKVALSPGVIKLLNKLPTSVLRGMGHVQRAGGAAKRFGRTFGSTAVTMPYGLGNVRNADKMLTRLGGKAGDMYTRSGQAGHTAGKLAVPTVTGGTVLALDPLGMRRAVEKK